MLPKFNHSHNKFTALAALALMATFSLTVSAGTTQPAREPIEWCNIWVPHANKHQLPRVLLIGDSITQGYYPVVATILKGKAYVARLTTSAFIADPALLQEITLVLDNYKFDVIQFNNGMHGWQHSEAEYRAGFPKFLATIREHAHGAKLIWADTTPLKNGSPPASGRNVDKSKRDLTNATDPRISARNAIAHEFIKPFGIPVDNLYTPMLGHPEYHQGKVHFNSQGTAIQGRIVAAEIEKLLK